MAKLSYPGAIIIEQYFDSSERRRRKFANPNDVVAHTKIEAKILRGGGLAFLS